MLRALPYSSDEREGPGRQSCGYSERAGSGQRLSDGALQRHLERAYRQSQPVAGALHQLRGGRSYPFVARASAKQTYQLRKESSSWNKPILLEAASSGVLVFDEQGERIVSRLNGMQEAA